MMTVYRITVITQHKSIEDFVENLVERAADNLTTHHYVSKHHLLAAKTSFTAGCCTIILQFAENFSFGVCSCCANSTYREVCRAQGRIGSGETLSHDIYPARSITTVSLAANTHCMMDGHSSNAPRTVGPRVQFSGACEQSH